MNGIITEEKYPIQKLWFLKSISGSLLILIILVPCFLFSSRLNGIRKNSEVSLYIVVIISFEIFHFAITALRRASFHYSIEEKFLTFKQGILSRQQRHIPYGVIQNILVEQDLFDKVFGLASLIIENASQSAGYLSTSRQQKAREIGFSGNRVSIPGLTRQSAETLKEIVLQKMKENPIEDSQSGL